MPAKWFSRFDGNGTYAELLSWCIISGVDSGHYFHKLLFSHMNKHDQLIQSLLLATHIRFTIGRWAIFLSLSLGPGRGGAATITTWNAVEDNALVC